MDRNDPEALRRRYARPRDASTPPSLAYKLGDKNTLLEVGVSLTPATRRERFTYRGMRFATGFSVPGYLFLVSLCMDTALPSPFPRRHA